MTDAALPQLVTASLDKANVSRLEEGKLMTVGATTFEGLVLPL
jgi:hypothetical protein